MNIGNYLKSIVPGLITIGYAVQAAVSDGKITNTEWAALGSLILSTVAAWLVPNTKPAAQTVQPTVTVSQPANVNAAATTTTVTEPAPPIL